MGKFKPTIEMEKVSARLREIERATKETAQASHSKRPRVDPYPPAPINGSRVTTEKVAVAVEEGLTADKRKAIADRSDGAANSPPNEVKLKPFLAEVSNAFSCSASEELTSLSPNSKKFRLAFNNIAMALYAQYDIFSELESVGPLREQRSELIRKLEVAHIRLEQREHDLAKLASLKNQADKANLLLRSDFERERNRRESEVKRLYEKVNKLSAENEKLKAVIESSGFKAVKDFVEDFAGEKLIRRINEARPDWDLSFLDNRRVPRGGLEEVDMKKASGSNSEEDEDWSDDPWDFNDEDNWSDDHLDFLDTY